MSKTKSVVMTIIISIVIAILGLMCVVPDFNIPFRVFGVYKSYNSVVSVINRGSDLGGGYSAVYYPEGVISAEEYDDTVRQYTVEYQQAKEEGKTSKMDAIQQAIDKYQSTYVAYTADGLASKIGADEKAVLYMEENVACYKTNNGYETLDSFEKNFEQALKIITKRFDAKNLAFLSVAKLNDYSIRVRVPYTVSNYSTLFTQMGYTGEFQLRSSSSNRALLKANGDKTLSDYFKSASSSSSGTVGYVVISLTSEGQDRIADITEKLKDNESDTVLYFYVGDTEVISLTVDKTIDQGTLYVSGSFTPETAENIAIVIDSCIDYGSIDTTVSVKDVVDYTIGSVDAVTMAMYIIFGVLLAATFIFSIVRYKGLGVVQSFAILSFLICMVMYMAFVPNIVLSAGTLAAVMITTILLALSNFYVFETVRKEFNKGKTLNAAIKDGYRSSLAALLDTNILLFAMGLLLYFISVGELIPFALLIVLGTVTGCVISTLVTRFYWYCMRGLVVKNRQYKFCGFFRAEVDDDED